MSKDKKELFKKVEGRLFAYKDLQIQINEYDIRIEEEMAEYRGCGAISYDERTGPTFNISRSVENEILSKEKRIEELQDKRDKLKREKRRIENAMTCLDIIETEFVNKYYNHRGKVNMNYIATSMHMDRSSCYRMRDEIVYKIMSLLHPEIMREGLPLLEII